MKKDDLKLLVESLLIIAVCFGALLVMKHMHAENQEYVDEHMISYVEFKDLIEEDKVEKVTFFNDSDSGLICVTVDGVAYYTTDPDYDTFRKELLEEGIEVEVKDHITVAGK